ncbi:MAG: hypothetical protein IRZ32_17135, partial [Solirubrobacteraceae bacterium]|nr:hypothetical protein [Solirubrobacteraceae bacterium]
AAGRGAEGAGRHAVALGGAAAAAGAAGDRGRRDELLDAAERLDARQPSYYGAAWVALGRVLLERSCGRDRCGGLLQSAAARPSMNDDPSRRSTPAGAACT